MNDESYRAYGNPEKVKTFLEDSMLVVGDDMFMTSSNALAHDLFTVYVFPHDYTFKLFGNTAVLSYLVTGYEIYNGDTIFYNVRDLKTFALDSGKWKVASLSHGFQIKNYFKPVAEKNQKHYASYAGVYKIKPGNFDTVFVKDGKLYDKITGDSVASWDFPVNDDEYMTKDYLDRFVFGKDSTGAISYYTTILRDGQRWKCPKIK